MPSTALTPFSQTQFQGWASFFGGNVVAPQAPLPSVWGAQALGQAPSTPAGYTGGWAYPDAWANFYEGKQGFTAPQNQNTPAGALAATNYAQNINNPNDPNLLGWEQAYGNPNTILAHDQNWAQSLGPAPTSTPSGSLTGGWQNPEAWAAYYGGTNGFTAPANAGSPASALAAASQIAQTSNPQDNPALLGWVKDYGQPGSVLANTPNWAASLGTPQVNAQGQDLGQTNTQGWDSPLAWAAYYGGFQGYAQPVDNTLQAAQNFAGVTNRNDPSLLGWELDYGNPQTVVSVIQASPAYQQFIAAQQQQQQAQQQFLQEQQYFNAIQANQQGYFTQAFAQQAQANPSGPFGLAWQQFYGAPATVLAGEANFVPNWMAATAIQNLIDTGQQQSVALGWESVFGPPGVEQQLQNAWNYFYPPYAGRMDTVPASYNQNAWTYFGPTQAGANLAWAKEAFPPGASVYVGGIDTSNVPPGYTATVTQTGNPQPVVIVPYGTLAGGPQPTYSSITVTPPTAPTQPTVAPNGTLQLPSGIGVNSSGGLANVAGVNVSDQFTTPNTLVQDLFPPNIEGPVTQGVTPLYSAAGPLGSGIAAAELGAASPGQPLTVAQNLIREYSQIQNPQLNDYLNFQRSVNIHNLQNFQLAKNAAEFFQFGGRGGEQNPGLGSPSNTGLFGFLNPTSSGALPSNLSSAAVNEALGQGINYLLNLNFASGSPFPAPSGGFSNPGVGSSPNTFPLLEEDLAAGLNPDFNPDLANALDAQQAADILGAGQQGLVPDLAATPYTPPIGDFENPSGPDVIGGGIQPSEQLPPDPFTRSDLGGQAPLAPSSGFTSPPDYSSWLGSAEPTFATIGQQQVAQPPAAGVPYLSLQTQPEFDTGIAVTDHPRVADVPNLGTGGFSADAFGGTYYAPPQDVFTDSGFGAGTLYQGGYGQPVQEQLPTPAPFSVAEQAVQRLGTTTTLRQLATAFGQPLSEEQISSIGTGVDAPIDLTQPYGPQLQAGIKAGAPTFGDTIYNRVMERLNPVITQYGVTQQGIMDAAQDVQQDVQGGPGAYGQIPYTTIPIYGTQPPDVPQATQPDLGTSVPPRPPADIPVDTGQYLDPGSVPYLAEPYVNTGVIPFSGDLSNQVRRGSANMFPTAAATAGIAGGVGQDLTTIPSGALPGSPIIEPTNRFQVNAETAPYFLGFLNALAAQGYDIDTLAGYNERNIAGSNTISQHSYGNAIDINAAQNAQHTGTGNMPANVAQLAAQYGLTWGGDWSPRSNDPMHFEATPAIAQGGALYPMSTGAEPSQFDLGNLSGPVQAPSIGQGFGGGSIEQMLLSTPTEPTFAPNTKAQNFNPLIEELQADFGTGVDFSKFNPTLSENIEDYPYNPIVHKYTGGSNMPDAGPTGPGALPTYPTPYDPSDPLTAALYSSEQPIQAGYNYPPGSFGEVPFPDLLPPGAPYLTTLPDLAGRLGLGNITDYPPTIPWENLPPLGNDAIFGSENNPNVRGPGAGFYVPEALTDFRSNPIFNELGIDWSRFNPTPSQNVEGGDFLQAPPYFTAPPYGSELAPSPHEQGSLGPQPEGGNYQIGPQVPNTTLDQLFGTPQQFTATGQMPSTTPLDNQEGVFEPSGALSFLSNPQPGFGGPDLYQGGYAAPELQPFSGQELSPQALPQAPGEAAVPTFATQEGQGVAAAPADEAAAGGWFTGDWNYPLNAPVEGELRTAQGGGNIYGQTSIADIEREAASQAAIQRFALALPNVTDPLTQLYSLIAGESGFNSANTTGSYRGFFQMSTAEAGGDPVPMSFAEQMDRYTNWARQNDPTGMRMTNLGLFNAASNMNLQSQPDDTVVYRAGSAAARANANTWGRFSPQGAGGDITIGGIKAYYARNNPATSTALGNVGAPMPFAPLVRGP